MKVLFLSPAYPPEMQQFTRGLAAVGASVLGVGDSPARSLPKGVKDALEDYLQVPSALDEEDVTRRLEKWLRGRWIDRVETNWEVMMLLAADLRARWSLPGMRRDAVIGFRDKVAMRERVAAAGIRVPRSARVRTAKEVWAAAERIGFPLIFKPIAGAGSADTWAATSKEELEAVLARTAHVPEASVEELIEGDEYTYETVCSNGVPLYEGCTRYYPNVLEARKKEWISPIILTLRDRKSPLVADAVEMGRKAVAALGMGSGFTHMEWFRSKKSGEAVFGEIACRAPGANMVDLMNYAGDVDLFVEWARAVVHGRVDAPPEQKYHAGIVFIRAKGQGRITKYVGLDEFMNRYRDNVARVDLLPIGAPRRDWRQTFLSDGNIVVRDPDHDTALAMAREAAATIQIHAGG
ncbi:MAG: ATP-grasp domain-containing protein [Labilithrix sp.]|nr:ATP-grasp domain-containing protein [Labilithrix sp.]MCW5815748.1 ATP-grasp domain-containing protein [Labilithrix sp.]